MKRPKTSIAILIVFLLLIFLTHIETAETEKMTTTSLSDLQTWKIDLLKVGESQKVVQNIYTKTPIIQDSEPKKEIKKFLAIPQQVKPNIQTGGVVEEPKKDLLRIGFRVSLSTYIIRKCNELAPDPKDCIIAAWFMGYAESSAGRAAYKNNVFWLRGWSFKTQEAAFDRWLTTYLSKWYKWIHPKYYYSPKPWLPKTHYCTDEVQPNGKVLPYCPNGYKNAMYAFRILTD